jgi:hypothetical protein
MAPNYYLICFLQLFIRIFCKLALHYTDTVGAHVEHLSIYVILQLKLILKKWGVVYRADSSGSG